MTAIAVRRLFILNFQDGRRLSESQSDHLMVNGKKRTVGSASDKICRQAGIVLEYFRPRKEGREFRIILGKQEGKESEA